MPRLNDDTWNGRTVTNEELGIPEGYIPGQGRGEPEHYRTHLYKIRNGNYDDIEGGMCKRAYNRDGNTVMSIFRNNVSMGGICQVCLRRAKAGLPVSLGSMNRTAFEHADKMVPEALLDNAPYEVRKRWQDAYDQKEEELEEKARARRAARAKSSEAKDGGAAPGAPHV